MNKLNPLFSLWKQLQSASDFLPTTPPPPPLNFSGGAKKENCMASRSRAETETEKQERGHERHGNGDL